MDEIIEEQKPQSDPIWLSTLNTRLEERNAVETKPYREIYDAFSKLWSVHHKFTQQYLILNQQVVILQHEIREEISKGDTSPAVDRLKLKLQELHDEIRDANISSKDEIKQRLALTNKVNELSKENFDLQDELKITRFELNSSRDSIRTLELHVENLNSTINLLKDELSAIRLVMSEAEERVRKLEIENNQLTNRIITEKLKDAQEMNTMRETVSQSRSLLVSGGINLLKFGHSRVVNTLGGIVTGTKSNDQTTSGRPSSSSIISTDGLSGNNDKNNGSRKGSRSESFSAAPVHSNNSNTLSLASSDKDSSYVTDDFNDILRETNPHISSTSPPQGQISHQMSVEIPSEPRNILSCHNTEINDIVYSSHHYITAGADSLAKVFDINSHALLHNLLAGGPVYSLDLVGDLVLGACSDRSVRLWSVNSGRLIQTLSSHGNKVFTAKFLERVRCTNQRIVTGGSDRSLRLFELYGTNSSGSFTSKLMTTMTTNSSVYSVAVSGDGNTIVSGHQDGGLRIWDSATSQKTHLLPKLHANHVTSVQFSPMSLSGGSCLILTSSKDNTLCLCDSRSFEVVRVLDVPLSFRIPVEWSKVTFSTDGRFISAGSADGTLVVWDTFSGRILRELSKHHTCSIDAVFWGANGIASCDKQGHVIFWN